MGKKILVIDDDKLVLGTLKRLLKTEGYNVATGQSGDEALERIRQSNFDLIISDIRMPGIDGLETLKEIRAYLSKEGRERIPELVITGYDNDDNRKRATESKVAGYITKPFDLKELLTNIESNISAT